MYANLKYIYLIKKYFLFFQQTVGKVLLTYAEVVKADFGHWVESQETACILMNNIQQCRVQLEKVYESMGGDQSLKEDTKVVMHDLQQMLNDAIDVMAEKYSVALKPPVVNKVIEVNKLLHQVNCRSNSKSLTFEMRYVSGILSVFRYHPTLRLILNLKPTLSYDH